MSMGNVGGRPSSVTPPSGYPAGGWVDLRVNGWVSQNPGGGQFTPPPGITKQWPDHSVLCAFHVLSP